MKIKNNTYREKERIWNRISKIVPFAELDEERWEELLGELRLIIFKLEKNTS